MLDIFPSTFMGEQMDTETRGCSLIFPGLARLIFFIFQKLGSPNICTKACVLSRSEPCGIDDAVNGLLFGAGRQILRLHPAAVIYRIGSINSNSFFFFFSRHVPGMFLRGHDELPRNTLGHFQLVQFGTSGFRIGWL